MGMDGSLLPSPLHTTKRRAQARLQAFRIQRCLQRHLNRKSRQRRDFHKKSGHKVNCRTAAREGGLGHAPDLLYQSEQKFRLSELLARPDVSGPQARYIVSIESVVSIELSFSAPQDRTRTIRKRTPGRSSHFKLKIGSSAAHDGFCLMLLGSPPDMVHSPPLRSTGLSSLCGRPPCRKPVPPCPHHPRCSGLRVQSTANAPMCAALCGAEQKVFDC